MPRYLVTAGPTREKIDEVRDWGNIFTGGTGLAIARALADAGDVDLLTSNRAHADQLRAHPDTPRPITPVPFTSHADLERTLDAALARTTYDAVFMTAAVADYRPAGVFTVTSREVLSDGSERWIVRPAQASKVKSTHDTIAVLGARTEKLVDLFRTRWNHRGLLVKFKLEVGLTRDQLIKIGQASRKTSGADYLIANTLDMVSGNDAGAFLLSDRGEEWVPRDTLPTRMRTLVQCYRAKPDTMS
ncbi:MAG: phosphopantothenoylcysteine decarboxylase [Tepidisphaeraceae bacterium]